MKKQMMKALTGVMMLAAVMLIFIACGGGDDAPTSQDNPAGNNGGGNGGNGGNGGSIGVPQELIGAWSITNQQNYNEYYIFVFNADGTGKEYFMVRSSGKASNVLDFVYSYNSSNSSIRFFDNTYTVQFVNNNTKMNFLNGNEKLEFYRYSGQLPSVGDDDSGTDGDGQGGGTSGGGDTGGDGGTTGQAPSSPTGLNAQVSGTSVYVTWQSVNNATRYNIYRSSNPSNSYSKIGTSYSTSYTDNNPLSGYNYYKVSAVNSNGESPQSSYVSCNYNGGGGGSSSVPSAPTGVTATNMGSNNYPSILISWSSVSNATSYKVFRSSSSSGSYSQIGSSTSDTYMYDNNPLSGSNYYKVKAVNSAGESSYSSYAYYDNSIEYSPCPPTVSVSGTTSQTVSWSNPTSSGCGTPTSYEVYKRNPSTNQYELQKTTSSRSYTPSSSDIHPGKNMYAVKAINNSGSDLGYSYSQDVPLAKPSSFTAQKSGSDVKFTWSKVAWATGYQIYECSSASGNYTILDQITNGNQTTLTRYYPISSGTTRYFKIRAYFECSWITFYTGEFSSYKKVTF